MTTSVGIIEGFLKFLASDQYLTSEAVKRARTAFAATSQPIDIIIRELGLLPELKIAEALADYCGCETQWEIMEIDETLFDVIGQQFAAEHGILPTEWNEDCVEMIVANPLQADAIQAVSYLADRPAKLKIAARSAIEAFLKDRATSIQQTASSDVIEAAFVEDDVDRLLDIAREAPVVKFVSGILHRAVDDKATDIHIEPLEDSIRIRFRKDGILGAVASAPKAIAAGVISRIKILSRLNISERRLPQDGRLRISVRGQDVDFRISVVPSIFGETIVLRILDRTNVRLDLAALGYDESHIAQLTRIAGSPNGIILLTGPTGSGKTTTLYSILNIIDANRLKVFTVEDPVEYRMPGITQLQVNPAIDLTFASALRSVLRQDPDVILIGEIRDSETAKIAVQAALTGHLVLSTLHTNSAVGAVSRLRDMGIESYLLAATMRAIVGQRLLRKRCIHCAPEHAQVTCQQCQGSGYSGRTATFEIFAINETIRDAIGRDIGQSALELKAIDDGMYPLRKHAEDLVASGITSQSELARVVDVKEG